MKTKKIITAICAAVFLLELLSLPFNGWDVKKMNFLGFNTHIVASNSMVPEFMAGDIAITYTTDFDEIQVGDIITYLDDGNIIIHRVISKTDSYIKTKGDNNPTEDVVLIDRQNYMGKVVYHTKF